MLVWMFYDLTDNAHKCFCVFIVVYHSPLHLCSVKPFIHSFTQELTHSRTQRTYTCTRASTHSFTHARTHSLTHARTHARTHACTYAHTHMLYIYYCIFAVCLYTYVPVLCVDIRTGCCLKWTFERSGFVNACNFGGISSSSSFSSSSSSFLNVESGEDLKMAFYCRG